MVQSLSLSLSLSYINVKVIDGYLKQYTIFFLLNVVSVIYRYYEQCNKCCFLKVNVHLSGQEKLKDLKGVIRNRSW